MRASNCIIKYNGKTYTELEFQDFLDQNLIQLTFEIKDVEEINNIIDPNFQMMTNDEYSWLNTIFKKFYPKGTDRIKFLYTIVNSDKWGEWTESGIKLFANAAIGTGYHEAWHEFTQLFLTQNEKMSLYKDAVKNIPELNHLDANNFDHIEQIEEYLANDFMRYQLSDGKLILKDRAIRNILFRKILNFLKMLFGNKNEPENFRVKINELYSNLRNGELSNYKFNTDNIYFRSGLARSIPGFENLEVVKRDPAGAKSAILDHFDALIARAARIKGVNIVSIFDNHEIKKNLYNYVRGTFLNPKTLSQLSPENRELWEFIGKKENFQKFIEEHYERGTWNIAGANKTLEKSLIDSLEENIDIQDMEDEDNINGKQEWNLAGNEKDSRDVAANQVRFIVKSLIKKEITTDGRIEPVLNKYGFHSLVDFNYTWNFLQTELLNTIEYPDMYNKLVELSKEHSEILDLITQLPDPKKETLSEEEMFLALRFAKDLMRTANEIYIQVLKPTTNQDNEVVALNIERVRASNTAVRDVRERFQTNWRQSAENNPYITSDDEGNTYLNINQIRDDFTQPNSPYAIKAAYDKLSDEEQQTVLENRLLFLKSIGFIFSDKTLGSAAFRNFILNIAFNKNGKGSHLQTQLLKVYEFNRDERKIVSSLKAKDIRSKEQEITEPLSFFAKKQVLWKTNQARNTKPVYLSGNNNDINEFLQYEIKYSGNYFNNSSYTAAQKIQYENSLYNTLFMNITDLNDHVKYPTYQSLISNPELAIFDISKRPEIRDNIYLTSLFNLEEGNPDFGKRRIDRSDKSLSYKDSPFVKLKHTNYSGLQVSDNDSSTFQGDTTVQLEDLDRLIMNVSTVLNNGTTEILRTADKSAAFAIEISYPYIDNIARTRKAFFDYDAKGIGATSFKDLTLEKHIGEHEFIKFNFLFKTYIINELERIFKAKKLIKDKSSNLLTKDLDNMIKFNLTNDLLSEKTKSTLLSRIDNLIDTNPEISYTEFAKNMELEIIEDTEDSQEKYLKSDILSSIGSYLENAKENYKRILEKSGHVPGTLGQITVGSGIADDVIIRSYILNHLVYNIETGNLFFGDSTFFKDPFKRYAMYTSTGIMPETSKWFFNQMNKDKNFRLLAKSLGYETRKMDGEVHTVVLNDVEVTLAQNVADKYRNHLKNLKVSDEQIESIMGKFNSITESDAQGLVTLDFYRIFKKSIGFWYTQHENGYKKLVTLAAKKKELAELLSTTTKAKAPKILTDFAQLSGKSERQIELEREIKKLTPTFDELSLFAPIKLGYGGPIKNDQFYLPGYHKFSVYPILPGISTDDSNIENINNKMLKEGIDYVTFKSASKVVTLAKDGKIQNLYDNNEDRNIIDSKFFKNITFLKYYKEQLQIEPKEETESTFGSQMRKLIFSNKYLGGVPIDFTFKGNKDSRKQKWNSLTDKEKLKVSTLYKLHQRYLSLLHEAANVELELLLDEIGIEDYTIGKAIKIKNYQKLVDLALKEARKKDAPDSIEYFLRIAEDGKLKYPIEASKDKDIIKQVLLSIVNNRIVKPKINGQPLVQVAATGHEFKFKGKSYSDTLNPYSVDEKGNTIPMEVHVSFNRSYKSLLNFTSPIDGKRIRNLNRLNEAMRNEEWYNENIKYFTLVGYRIPSQAMNSIAYMKIKQFLSSESMDLIVLPSIITKIAGSDFDIDKMNVIRPFIDNIGEIPVLSGKRRNIIKVKNEISSLKTKIKELTNKIEEEKPQGFVNALSEIQDLISKDTLSNNMKAYLYYEKYLAQELHFSKVREAELLAETQDVDFPTLDETNKLDELEQLNKKIAGLEIVVDTVKQTRENFNKLTPEEKQDLIDDFYTLDEYFNERYDTYVKERELLTDKLYLLISESRQKQMINNEVFDIFVDILKRSDSFLNMVSPNDVDILKTESDFIKNTLINTGKESYSKSSSKTDIYNPVHIHEVYKSFLGSKKGLSIAALAAPHVQTFQRTGAYVNSHYTFNKAVYPTYIFLQTNKTVIDGVEYHDFSDQYDSTGTVLKSELVSQYISAYVDAANDPFIFYMNGSLRVAPVLVYLTFAGVPAKQAIYLVNQDSVREYIQKVSSTKSLVGKYEKAKTKKSYEKIHALVETWNKYVPDHLPEEFKDLAILNYTEAFGERKFYNKVHLLMNNIQNLYNTTPIEEVLKTENLKNNIENLLSPEKAKEANFYAFLQYLALENQSASLREINNELKFDTTLVKSVSSANFAITKLNSLMENKVKIEVDRKQVEVDPHILPNNVIRNIAFKSEISPYMVNQTIVDLYSDISKMEMHPIVQTHLNNLLNDTNTVQNKLKRERLIKDYFNDLTMFLVQNKHTKVGNEVIYDMEKEWGLIKRDSADKVNTSLKENISTQFINLLNKYNGVNDELNLLEYSEIAKNLVISTSKYTDFQTLKWIGNILRKDSINSYSAEWRFLANLQNEEYSDIRNFFRELAKVAFISYGEGRSTKSFYSLVPVELHAEFIIPYIKYFFEEMSPKRQSEFEAGREDLLIFDFLSTFKDNFKQNHPTYFKGRIQKVGDGKFVEYRLLNGQPNRILNQFLEQPPIEQEDELQIPDNEEGSETYIDAPITNTVEDIPVTPDEISDEILGMLPMTTEHIAQIKTGEKTITNRKDKFKNGFYTLPDGSEIELTLLGKYKIFKDQVWLDTENGKFVQSNYTKNEIARKEGYKNWEDFVKRGKFSDNFFNGTQSRYLYSISSIYNAPTEEVDSRSLEEQLQEAEEQLRRYEENQDVILDIQDLSGIPIENILKERVENLQKQIRNTDQSQLSLPLSSSIDITDIEKLESLDNSLNTSGKPFLDKYINSDYTTVTEVLEKIVENSNEDAIVNKVAKLLISIKDKNDTVALSLNNNFDLIPFPKGVDRSSTEAFFRPSENTLYFSIENINSNTEAAFQHVFIHELIHSYTVYPFYKKGSELTSIEKEFIDGITNIYNEAKNRTSRPSLNGFLNVKEFVSEIMSSESFRNEVRSLGFIDKIWQWIINLFKNYSLLETAEDIITKYLKGIDQVETGLNTLKNPNVERLIKEPKILSLSQANKVLNGTYPSKVSNKQLQIIQGKVSKINNELAKLGINIVYKTVETKRIPNTESFTWKLQELHGKLNIPDKIQRTTNYGLGRINTAAEQNLESIQTKRDTPTQLDLFINNHQKEIDNGEIILNCEI